MIKIFRKIRQKFLDKNNIGKYIFYAIGEILLVVIGILIALQVNNWNQKKIETKKEAFHLENILANLQDDLDNQIIPCMQKTERQIDGFNLLNTGLYENDNISNDSIRKLFFQFLAQWDLVLNTVAFENLKSTGMDVISNDSIKIALLTLYGHNYEHVKNLQEYYDKTHYDRVSTWFHDNNIEMWEKLTNEDKRTIQKDKRLYSGMKSEARYSLRKYLGELENIKPKLGDLIENIRGELARLKS